MQSMVDAALVVLWIIFYFCYFLFVAVYNVWHDRPYELGPVDTVTACAADK